MESLCILASTGSAVATCGFFATAIFGRLLAEESKPGRALAFLLIASLLLAAVGMGSCAAEDRICEVAGLQP